MIWRKRGLIFEPKGQYEWVTTHAWVPFAFPLSRDRYRVYFAGRNTENKSQIGYLEMNVRRPQVIEYLAPNPVVRLGNAGLFDDSAAIPSWVTRNKDTLYMYYIGWVRGVDVPYAASIGLATSSDGGAMFTKHSTGPIIGRSEVDPYICASCCVLVEGKVWKMWYLSAVDFRITQGRPMYYYVIKYAESEDGIAWKLSGRISIGFKSKSETRISRPCVIRDRDGYKMWYSYADPDYRIGYAESSNGADWVRKDELGLDVSEAGWDSEMVCYPHVFDHEGKRYMLYNGNSYGKTGIGYATLESG
jgi:hypothetical protein